MTETDRMDIVSQARRAWADDDLEIDDNAQVNATGDNTGHWVQAWVYMPASNPHQD